MQGFVTSMEGSCHNSNAIAKHHQLIQVFYSVAARYTELVCPSAPMHEEQRKIKSLVHSDSTPMGNMQMTIPCQEVVLWHRLLLSTWGFPPTASSSPVKTGHNGLSHWGNGSLSTSR